MVDYKDLKRPEFTDEFITQYIVDGEHRYVLKYRNLFTDLWICKTNLTSSIQFLEYLLNIWCWNRNKTQLKAKINIIIQIYNI